MTFEDGKIILSMRGMSGPHLYETTHNAKLQFHFILPEHQHKYENCPSFSIERAFLAQYIYCCSEKQWTKVRKPFGKDQVIQAARVLYGKS